MVWADGENNILKEEPISSVAQIKKIIGRNLEYLPKLLPSPVQEAPSPAQIVNSLTAHLKDNSKTLDSASLTQIRKDLKQLRTELQKPEVSAKIDRQISAKRTRLPKITPQRKEELLTATSDKDIEEANIRFTSVQSIITNINTCIARITDHLKSKQEPIIDPSLSQAASPNKQVQEAASASELAQTKTDPAEEHRDIQTPALGATAEETINSQELKRKELYATFQEEKKSRDELIGKEDTAQQEKIEAAIKEAKEKKAKKVEKANEVERLRKNSFDEDEPEPSSRPVTFAPRQPLPPIMPIREVSPRSQPAPFLEAEYSEKREENPPEQPPPSSQDTHVERKENEELINVAIEKIKEPDTYDRVIYEKRQDILDQIVQETSVTQPVVSPEPLIIPQEVKSKIAVNERNLVMLHDRDSMDSLDQAAGLIGGEATPNAPQLELLSAEAIREKPVIEDKHARLPPAVPLPATDEPSKGSAPHKEPLLDSVPPGTTQLLSDLSARLGSLEGELVESNRRQSVLHCPDQSVGVSFHKENFCREFATEYNNNIEEGKKITVIDNSSPQEATDNPLTKKLSFSADGKTVTLPKDNIVHDTVCALNNIARSNMRNRNKGSDFSEPVIKIKEVQEKDLLDILQKFNAGITASIVEPDASTSTNLKGHLQLSYENPNPGSLNNDEIQEIIKKHNDLHATLQKENVDPEKVQEKLVALKSAITALDKKLTTPEPSPVKLAEPEHDSANHPVRLR